MFDGIDLQKMGDAPTDGVFSADLSIALSTNEQKWLAAARMLYEDFELFIDRVYSKRKSDSAEKFARMKAPPAYHINQHCDNLLADFEEFLVPVEVAGRGDAEVERFRKWFADNEELLLRNQDAFIARAVFKFRLNGPKSMELIARPNSGVTRTENKNLDNVNAQIGKLLREAELLRRPCKTQPVP